MELRWFCIVYLTFASALKFWDIFLKTNHFRAVIFKIFMLWTNFLFLRKICNFALVKFLVVHSVFCFVHFFVQPILKFFNFNLKLWWIPCWHRHLNSCCRNCTFRLSMLFLATLVFETWFMLLKWQIILQLADFS